MTQLNPPTGLLLPQVARRSPSRGYSVSQTSGSSSWATKRVLGMWVPGEAFRKGTRIRVTGNCSTVSVSTKLSFGGNGSAIALGTTVTFTGSAVANYFIHDLVQRTDTWAGSSFDIGGIWLGTTVLNASYGAIAFNIQPLNYIELSTNGTFSLWGTLLEVIPPQSNIQRQWQEIQDL